MRRNSAHRDLLAVCVLLALAAVGCSNPFEPPLGTPHMKGTWKGAANNATLTVILGSVQECNGFCISDSGPITYGAFTDAALRLRESIGGGYYIVGSPCCGTPVTDITSWSIVLVPILSTDSGRVTISGSHEFDGRFTSSTTIVATAIFSNTVGVDTVTITLVKQ